MNSYTRYILIFLNTICVLSAPANNKEDGLKVYDKLVELSKDDNYKCPYLRKTILLNPEPSFLNSCYIPDQALSSKEFRPILASYALCSLYYESFKKLCTVTPHLPLKVTESLFGDDVLKSKLGLNKTCDTLLSIGTKVSFEINLSAQVVKDGELCKRLCADEGGATPLCEWSALMLLEATAERAAEKPKVLENTSKEIKHEKPVPEQQNSNLIQPIAAAAVTNEKIGGERKGVAQNNNSGNIAAEVTKPTPVDNKLVNSNQVVNLNQSVSNSTMLKTTPKMDIKSTTTKANELEQKSTNNSDKLNTDVIMEQTQSKPTPIEEGVNKNPTNVGENGEGNLALDNMEADLDPVDEEAVQPPIENEDIPVAKSPQNTPVTVKIAEASNGQVETQPQLEKEDTKKGNNNEYDEDDEGKKPAENTKPLEIDEDIGGNSSSFTNQSLEEDDSYFFSYFMMICIVFILGYVGYHNKQKILAMVLEGRRGKRQQRRRPNSANYHKLDSNLEEAVTSSCNKNTTNIIY